MTNSDKKNRGEWSELYALTRILSMGKIHAGSTTDNGENPVFPVVAVSRRIDGIEHEFRIAGLNVEIINVSKDAVTGVVARNELADESDLLFTTIKAGKGRSFSIPQAMSIMSTLQIEKVSGASEKNDLTITTYDPRIRQEIRQGFSIKSFIGSKPTLLNASGATNIDYAISETLKKSEVIEFNNLGPIDLVSSLYEKGYYLTPKKMDDRFSENLKMIDGEMDKLISYFVLASFRGKGRTMRDIVEILDFTNPMNYSPTNSRSRYTHKVKDLLEAVALGMRPSEPWSGQSEASGGNLIVTSGGEILCHHALDKDSLRTYLFENTLIDTPSRRRHKFGSIINNVLTLNFQIRFK
jgi:hypothetical protein